MFAFNSDDQLGQNLSNLFSSKSNSNQNDLNGSSINPDNNNNNLKRKNKLTTDENEMDFSDEENINLSNIKVTVGIDEDLQMILEMDPSIVDLGIDANDCGPTSSIASPLATPKMNRWSPISAG